MSSPVRSLPYGTDVRPSEFWPLVVERLSSGVMERLLGAPGRVYLDTDDYGDAEGGRLEAWARVAVVPTQTLWPQADEDDRFRRVAWLVRADVNAIAARGFTPAPKLDAVQAEVKRLLANWLPSRALYYAIVAQPVYRAVPPPQLPSYDGDRGVWYSSSEWRTSLAPR